MTEFFRRFSLASSTLLGSPWMFVANVVLILIWAFSGPFFRFSDTWQLVVNTATTVITYLAVFLIQNTQNRDARAVHLKLDEIIVSIEGARNHFVDIENIPEAELQRLEPQFRALHERARAGDKDAVREIAEDIDEAVDKETKMAGAKKRDQGKS
jgi:low affinity Fe/Cu permease